MIIQELHLMAYSFDDDILIKVEEIDDFIKPTKVWGVNNDCEYVSIEPDRILPYTFYNDEKGNRFYLNDVVKISIGGFDYYRMIDFERDIGYYVELKNRCLNSNRLPLKNIYTNVRNMGSVYRNKKLELGRLADFALDNSY